MEVKLAGTGGVKRGGRAGEVVVEVVVGAAGVDVKDEAADAVLRVVANTGGGRSKMSNCSSSCGDKGALDLDFGIARKRSSKKLSS